MPELPPGEYVTVGGDVDRITVSVRVGGDDLDPDEVTRVLGVEPTFAARKGDRRRSAGGEVVQRTGVWCVNFEGAPEEWTLGDAVGQLVARLPHDPAVWEGLAARYSLDVFCGLHMSCWNRGFALDPALLRQLADRHLKLDVDIYYVGSGDEGEAT
jgi:hypothetical protein